MSLCLQFPFEDNLFQSLFYPIQTKFLETVNTLCGRIPQVFLKQIEKTMRKVYEERVIKHVRSHKWPKGTSIDVRWLSFAGSCRGTLYCKLYILSMLLQCIHHVTLGGRMVLCTLTDSNGVGKRPLCTVEHSVLVSDAVQLGCLITSST